MEMTALVHHQAKPAAEPASSSLPIAKVQGEETKSFVQMLSAAIGGQTETPTDKESELAESLLAGALPVQHVLLVLSQLDLSDLKDTISQILAALEAGNSELRQAVVTHPALLAWVQEANQWLSQQANVKVELPSQSSLVVTTEAGVTDMLMRFMQQLASQPSTEEGNRIASQLQHVVQELARTVPGFPALQTASTAVNDITQDIRTSASQQTGIEQRSANASGQGQQEQGQQTSPKQNGDAQATRQTMLERLSFMRMPVHIVTAAQEQSRSAEVLVAARGQAEAASGLASMLTDRTAGDESVPAHQLQALANKPAFVQEAKGPVQTTVTVQHFAAELSKFMVKNMTITQLGGISEAKISLVPEHLGQLDVKISIQNGMITAAFTAETAAAREMLENQLPQLRSALQQQGLQVDKLMVSHQQSEGFNLFQDGHQQHTGGEQQQRGEKQQAMKRIDDIDFWREMEESLMDDDARYGSTFHATA